MLNRQKVIDVALSQVGYHEKASWDNLDDPAANPGSANYNKYSRDLEKYHYYNSTKRGVMWCDIFVDWSFMTAYGAENGRKMLYQPLRSSGAGCRYSRDYFIQHRALSDTPAPGDQVFFWPADHKEGDAIVQHTGLVVDVTATRVYTVEGNSNDRVARHSYPLDYARFAGFGRPNWDIADDSEKAGGNMETMKVKSPNGKHVRVRSAPGKTAPIIEYLDVGTIVQAEPEVAGWRKIEWSAAPTSPNHGYMMDDFLAPVGDEEEPTPAPPSGNVYTLTVEQYNKLCEARDILIGIVGMG